MKEDETKDADDTEKDGSGKNEVALELKDVKSEEEIFQLKNINLKIPQGGLVGIIGPVASGKTSLLTAMVGEMELMDGAVLSVKDEKFLGSQTHFIENDTFRNNILMNKRYDRVLYRLVLDCIALTKDVENLVDGDETEIGERGINLSGGQK
eukprot:UN34060